MAFLAVFGWFFSGGSQIVKAQTIEELTVQISALQKKIADFQKEMAELQARIATIRNEIAKLQAELVQLLGKQISLIQNRIAQLRTELLTKKPSIPESEYKCPDINGNGVVDLADLTLLAKAFGSCQGDANYDQKADFDKDNCVTTTDQAFLQKYYGKKTTEITQCKVVAPSIPESEYKCPDINGNGVVDLADLTLLAKAFGSCQGDANYDQKADFDKDNCVTTTDQAFLQKYYGKKTTEITQCKGVTTLEDMGKMLASIAETISQLTQGIKELLR
jgi:hypothetical protein